VVSADCPGSTISPTLSPFNPASCHLVADRALYLPSRTSGGARRWTRTWSYVMPKKSSGRRGPRPRGNSRSLLASRFRAVVPAYRGRLYHSDSPIALRTGRSTRIRKDRTWTLNSRRCSALCRQRRRVFTPRRGWPAASAEHTHKTPQVSGGTSCRLGFRCRAGGIALGDPGLGTQRKNMVPLPWPFGHANLHFLFWFVAYSKRRSAAWQLSLVPLSQPWKA